MCACVLSRGAPRPSRKGLACNAVPSSSLFFSGRASVALCPGLYQRQSSSRKVPRPRSSVAPKIKSCSRTERCLFGFSGHFGSSFHCGTIHGHQTCADPAHRHARRKSAFFQRNATNPEGSSRGDKAASTCARFFFAAATRVDRCRPRRPNGEVFTPAGHCAGQS